MPNSSEVLQEIKEAEANDKSAYDTIRGKHVKRLAEYTGRNTIIYYSGWLTCDPALRGVSIGDEDMNGFMAAIHGMDRSKGLDLVLHTPGGDIAATEALVCYLRSMFGRDIRAIVPQLAMSAGTMMACATSEIIMGKQSSLGPFDPQANGISMPAVLDEFKRAIQEITANPACTPLWQVIIGRYHPTFLDDCHRATVMSQNMVRGWLETGMFVDDPESTNKAQAIVASFSDHDHHKIHARHIPMEKCVEAGLKIVQLEDDETLQDLVLTVHHACMHSCSLGQIVKIIENDSGACVVLSARPTPSPAA